MIVCFQVKTFYKKDGFGNLIALPLQKEARKQGNSVFIDENFDEVKDQWIFLSHIKRVSEEDISRICSISKASTKVVKSQIQESEKDILSICKTDFPGVVIIEKGRGFKVSKEGLSPKGSADV